MLTPNTLLRIINDAREKLGIPDYEFAKKAGILDTRWSELKRGRRELNLKELPKLAKASGLAFQVVAPHHEPFMQLTQEEAADLLKLADHYRRNGPSKPHPLRTAVEKLTGR